MQYAECLQKYYNAVDGTFYDAINLTAFIVFVQALFQTPQNPENRS